MDDLKMVRLEIADHVAVVTMDNPPVNAQNAELQDEMIRTFDRLSDLEDVRVAVLTGKGNIIASRRHSTAVTGHVLDRYLGVPQNGPATAAQQQLAEYVDARPGLTAEQIEGLLARVRARQEAVGYTMSYKEWLARVTPPDLA